MNLFKLFAALGLLSATASTAAFSLRTQACHNHVSSRGRRTGAANQSWCLHNYSADEIDCSYVDRSQCAATAAGGLGQCAPSAFRWIACAGCWTTCASRFNGTILPCEL
jgi:hypothetical protein